MKPRIYKSGGAWVCFVLDRGMRRAAMGQTPTEAYGNWKAAYNWRLPRE